MVVGSTDVAAPDLEVKIILLGDYSVGKSSLLRVLARQSDHLLDDEGVSSGSGSSNRSSYSSSSLTSRRNVGMQLGNGALVTSCLQPGAFVQVAFTHQDRTVMARISDTGGE